jgi:L-methionine (R)-S-oxide reductase
MEKLSFTEILNSDRTRSEKARLIAEKIRTTKKYSWVGLYDVKEKEITIISFAGRSEPAFTSFPKDKGLNGRAVKEGKPVIVNDTLSDEDYLLTFSNTKSEIVVPVFAPGDNEIAGTIDAESETKDAFSKEDAGFLEECAAAIRVLWSKNQSN